MFTLDLGGRWQFRQTESRGARVRPGLRGWMPARVPGCVHTDLLAAGRIPDPFVGMNELAQQWIDEADWEYRRAFDVPASALGEGCRRLVCEGLDTAAEVRLNGRPVGRADNMFRRWTFDAARALRAGRNELVVRFRGAVAAARERAAGRELPGNVYHWGTGRTRRTDRNWLRKAQYQFGWDWGPMLATCGVWRGIRLECFSAPAIEYVAQTQEHSRSRVRLRVRVGLLTPAASAARPFRLRVELRAPGRSGAVVASATKTVRPRAGESRLDVALDVRRPRLWWPAGHGGQPLYGLSVELLPASGGRMLQRAVRRVGLRSVELVNRPDRAGRSFFLKVNGRPVFCKGANWIPADIFPTRVKPAVYRSLLESAVAAGMNMLRIWGGGIYEADAFYDLCDELGLMLWHDHMFACAAYPADAAFLGSVEAEIRDGVRRLSCHPCIALWCGNNENEEGMVYWWAKRGDAAALRRDYLKLTAREERVTRREAPDLPWWPSSPSTDGRFAAPNDHTSGDSHFWEVWHGRKPFSRYLEIRPRFNSEFGFQSFPDAETLRPVLTADRSQWSLTSPVMEQHQRHGSGNAIITEMACSFFRIPQNPGDFFYVSQLLQGLAIRAGVEHWRRQAPGCMGTLYWQLNDCWPVASWSSVDSALRWKALHHFARRFYSPLLASLLDDAAAGRVRAFVTSDLAESVRGRWTLELRAWSGRLLRRRGGSFALKPLSTQEAMSWPVAELAAGFDRRAEAFVRLTAEGWAASGRRFRSESWLPLSAWKRAELAKPRFRLAASGGPERFRLRLVSDAVAPFTEIRTGRIVGRFSDNFLDLLPGRAVTVEFRPAKPVTLAGLRRELSVRTLRTTY